jgi:hypothetical protein
MGGRGIGGIGGIKSLRGMVLEAWESGSYGSDSDSGSETTHTTHTPPVETSFARLKAYLKVSMKGILIKLRIVITTYQVHICLYAYMVICHM